MRELPLVAAAFGLALSSAAALSQDGPPVLDIDKTCGSPGRAQAGLSQKDSQDGCLRSERAAHDELKRRWGEFSPGAKSQCGKQAVAGGFPSYVETVTCLELATGGAPAQTGTGGDATAGNQAKGGRVEGRKDSDLTAEPSPNQRTNPIDVLDKKP